MAISLDAIEALFNQETAQIQGYIANQDLQGFENTTTNSLNDLRSRIQALSQLCADIFNVVSLNAIKLADIQSLLLKLGNPQQKGSPVTLPSPAPAGYNTSGVWSGTDIFAAGGTHSNSNAWFAWAIWNNLISLELYSMQQWNAFPVFAWSADVGILSNDYSPKTEPGVLDFSGVRATDTLLSWLQREDGVHTWSYVNGDASGLDYCQSNELDNTLWYTTINNAQFQAMKKQIFASLATPLAPVWPGLANVTFGAPIAFGPADTGKTIPGPLDGVIYTITAVSYPVGSYNFNGDLSYVKSASITFQTDDGQDEFAQAVSFQAGIVVPKSMARAALAKLRLRTGTTGTITPWTVT